MHTYIVCNITVCSSNFDGGLVQLLHDALESSLPTLLLLGIISLLLGPSTRAAGKHLPRPLVPLAPPDGILPPLGIVQVLPAVPNDETFPQIPEGRLAREGSGLHRHLALLGGPNVDGAGAGQDLVLPPPLLAEGPMSLAPINVGAALDAGQLGAGYLYAMLMIIIIITMR